MSIKGNRIIDSLPREVRKITDKYNYKVGRVNMKGSKNPKYTKQHFLRIYEGYDMLENLLLVRIYIQRRFKVDLHLLEMLLYLSPKHYFTQKDYAEMPKNFSYTRIDNLVKTGMVRIAADGKHKHYHLYSLSAKGRTVISTFYKLLSGEEKIPVEKKYNPMADENAFAIDKKRLELIKKFNELPISDMKRMLHED